MIYFQRWLTRLLLIVLVGLFERVMGLPVMMIVLTSLYAGCLDRFWRWGLLLVVGVMMAALFMVPLSISWLVMSLSYVWSKHARRLFSSKAMRLIVGSIVGSVTLVIFSFGQVYLQQLIYGVIAIFIYVVWLKRHRFYLK